MTSATLLGSPASQTRAVVCDARLLFRLVEGELEAEHFCTALGLMAAKNDAHTLELDALEEGGRLLRVGRGDREGEIPLCILFCFLCTEPCTAFLHLQWIWYSVLHPSVVQ